MAQDVKAARRVRLQDTAGNAAEDDGQMTQGRIRPIPGNVMESQEPFMGVKIRRRASMYRQFQGDYLNVASNQQIFKLLSKQGDKQVLFADSIMKVNQNTKIRKRILLITNVALYTLDPNCFKVKRRISLQDIEKVFLSEFSDNFFAITVPAEYDCLLASTRKTEIVTVLVEATKQLSSTDTPIEVCFSNRFEYYMDSENSREVLFEQVEGGVKTKFIDK